MKAKHNWFKNLLSHKTSRPSELTPPPGSPKTSEEMRSEEAIFAVVKEFDKAVVKHPFFAHRPMRNYPVGYANNSYVAHECCHAGFAYAKRLGKRSPYCDPEAPEERVAYPVGVLTHHALLALNKSGL